MTREGRLVLLLIGAVPPPYHGVTTMNQILLRAGHIRQQFHVNHLDLSDRRPVATLEKLDLINVYAALRDGIRSVGWLLWRKPDVVYLVVSQKTLGFLRDALFLVPARLLGRKTIVHIHGGNFGEFYRHASGPLRTLIRFSLGRLSRAIVLGESLRPMLAGLVPPERIVVIPNGIPDFAGAVAQLPCRRGKPVQVLYLGTVLREKGAEVFVQAALQVLAQTEDAQFIVAGPWYRERERVQLQALVNAEGRGHRILFLDEVTGDVKSQLLLESHIVVFPSVQQEGLPLVVLEAMCAGRVVVASDCGCLREVIVDGETGFLVPPGDTSAIATKVIQLTLDGELRAKLGAAGRARYDQRYRDTTFTERIGSLFREVCAEIQPRCPGGKSP